MFLVIIQAANEAKEFIEKAKIFARQHFAKHDPKVIVRNADAYEPREHEKADVVITTPERVELIAAYESRDTHVIVVDHEEEKTAAEEQPAPPVEEAPPSPASETAGSAETVAQKPADETTSPSETVALTIGPASQADAGVTESADAKASGKKRRK